jgi:hypothetical protein
VEKPSFAAAWYAQRRAAAAALATVHDDELRALSDAEATRRADALLSIPIPASALPEQRRTSSGLVEQQRLFARRRR